MLGLPISICLELCCAGPPLLVDVFGTLASLLAGWKQMAKQYSFLVPRVTYEGTMM